MGAPFLAFGANGTLGPRSLIQRIDPRERPPTLTRTLDYLRRNALAALALACSLLSLAGASYAAFSLAPGSVGTRELHNGAVTSKKLASGSITPAKLSTNAIGGSIRHWASVSQGGRVLAGSRGARVLVPGPLYYSVGWGDRFPRRCIALTNSPGNNGAPPFAASIGVQIVEPHSARRATVVDVFPHGSNQSPGAPFDITLPFDIAVLC